MDTKPKRSGGGRKRPASKPGPDGKPHSSAKARRTAARLNAVQAAYQVELRGVDAEIILGEYVDHHFDHPPALEPSEDEPLEVMPEQWVVADRELMAALVRGARENIEQIDRHLRAVLDRRYPLDRIEMVLRAILRTAAYELMYQGLTPAPIIISDYVEIAHGFFAEHEPGLVNAILNALKNKVRAADGSARWFPITEEQAAANAAPAEGTSERNDHTHVTDVSETEGADQKSASTLPIDGGTGDVG